MDAVTEGTVKSICSFELCCSKSVKITELLIVLDGFVMKCLFDMEAERCFYMLFNL